MSSTPLSGSITPMTVDPEKGLLDRSPDLAVVSFEVSKSEKLNTTTDVVVVDPPKSAPSKPSPKPKRKVSNWILWQLWFNTYRYHPTLHLLPHFH